MEKLNEKADFKQKRHLLDRPFVYKLGIGSSPELYLLQPCQGKCQEKPPQRFSKNFK
jgi:hypothetical protein